MRKPYSWARLARSLAPFFFLLTEMYFTVSIQPDEGLSEKEELFRVATPTMYAKRAPAIHNNFRVFTAEIKRQNRRVENGVQDSVLRDRAHGFQPCRRANSSRERLRSSSVKYASFSGQMATQ